MTSQQDNTPRRRRTGRNEESTSPFLDRWRLDPQNEFDENTESGSPTPVTVKLVDLIEEEHEQEYLNWQRGISRSMEDVVHPSRVASILLRELVNSQIRFVLLFRFESKTSAEKWHDSNERKAWLEKLPETEFYKRSTHEEEESATSSMDEFPMFHVASFADNSRQRWRAAFLVWLQVFGLVELLGVLLPLLLGHVTWSSLSLHLQIAVSTAMTTLCIECCTMKLFVTTARFLRFLR